MRFNKGFTLIEMLVVALILIILMGAIIGVFVSVVKVQRYTLAAQSMLDQTSYTMEYMSRHLRMAREAKDDSHISKNRTYEEANSCNEEGCTAINFLNYNEEKRAFVDWNGFYEYKDGDYISLLGSGLKVNNFNIHIEEIEGFLQPRVTFFLDIEADSLDFNPNIKIQTTVSQRDLDQ